MKALRTMMVLIAALSLPASMAAAQSLAEVAKKEKKRRETNKAEAKRVITDRELTYGYGGENTSSSVTVPGGEEGEGEEGTEAEAGSEGGEPQQDETETREYWQARVKAARDKIAGLEKQLQERQVGDAQPQNVDPRGANRLQQQQELEQQLATARGELQAIQAEARRAGVPPGWVR